MKTILNKTILLLSASVILSCDNDKNDIPVEQSLEDFSISLKNVSQQSAEIQWSPVTDSQENEILYDVYLSEGKTFPAEYTQVAKDIKDTSYSFNKLTSCADYYAYIEAHDSKGNVNRQSFSFKTNGCNIPPTDFEVTINVNEENTSAVVNWTQATDPEKDNVIYDIYLNDQLIDRDLNALTYTLSNLEYVTEYKVTIAAKDNSGAKKNVHQYFKTCIPDISGNYEVFSSIIVGPLYRDFPSLNRYKSQIQITNNKDGTYTISDITAGVIAEQWNNPKRIYPAIITDNCGEYTASLKNVNIGNPCNVNFEGKYDPDSEDIVIEFSWTAKLTQYTNKQTVKGFMRKIPKK